MLHYLNHNGIKSNDTIATFSIARTDFQYVNNISMRFSTRESGESDRNFIVLDLSEPAVKKFLGLKGQPDFLLGILSLRSSLISIIVFWLLIPLLLFLGNKANSYTSVLERWLKNRWLRFNVNVVIFSTVILLIYLFVLFVTGRLKEPSFNLYFYLIIIPVFPFNLVYVFDNVFVKRKAIFWLRQYLSLIVIPLGLFAAYIVCNDMTHKMIARKIISLDYVILFGILIGFTRVINNYITYQKVVSLKEKELEITRLNELKVRSDLNALQSKINPHFLYNALNSIAELCWKDAEKTERMALSLSKLFRYSVNKEESDFNPLKTEIEIVGLYLTIEKERFGDNLNYEFDYSSDIENLLIPKFTLQPLIENAIKHGIAKKPTGGRIKLTVKKTGNHLEIKVYDNGPDFPVNLMSGYGLQSIYDKLDILFPKRYSIELQNGTDKNITIILKDAI
jgi:sensor histidine kinase YesM